MNRLAVTISALSFFALALVGYLSGVPIFVCGLRALGGSAVLYVLMRIVGGLAIQILLAGMSRPTQRGGEKDSDK